VLHVLVVDTYMVHLVSLHVQMVQLSDHRGHLVLDVMQTVTFVNLLVQVTALCVIQDIYSIIMFVICHVRVAIKLIPRKFNVLKNLLQLLFIMVQMVLMEIALTVLMQPVVVVVVVIRYMLISLLLLLNL
jgi:hypothetical protein